MFPSRPLALGRGPLADPSRFLVSALSLSLLAPALAAQTQFEERLPKRYLPAVAGGDLTLSDLGVADFDGDGDLDAIFANELYPPRVYLNDGGGIFTDASATHLPPFVVRISRRIAVADIDGDGDVDALLTSGRSSSSNPLLLVNDGTAHFSDETALRFPANALRDATRALFADIDADGDLDLVSPNQVGSRVNVYLNDGAGVFTDDSVNRMPALLNTCREAALADVDADGDVDLLLTNHGQDRLYLNDGAGFFADATATHLPVETTSGALSMALADVDADGDLDMIVGEQNRKNTLRLNDGQGVFTDASTQLPSIPGSAVSTAVGDVDGDGDVDLVFGGGGQSRLFLNDGSGTFVDAPFPARGSERDDAFGLALADVDADGDPDVLMGRPGFDRLYLNDGSGGFRNATPERVDWATMYVAAIEFADLDLDGDQDVLVADGEFMRSLGSVGYGEARAQLNDGTGSFPTSQRIAQSNPVALAVGDVDGNGAPDVLVGVASVCFLGYGCWAPTNELYLNDGSGSMSRAAGLLPSDSDDTFAVALEDLDGDGDLDALLGNWQQQNRLYLNDGGGTFTDATARLPVFLDQTRALAVEDFDGDGDLDIVVGNEGEQSRMYVNVEGLFHDDTAARMPPLARKTRALAAGDLDGDGDMDLVLGNDGQPGLYRNNGAGKLLDFTDWMPQQVEHTWAVRLGDIDEDGDLDVVLGNRSPGSGAGSNRVLLNDGTAHFTDGGRLPSDAERTAAVALADVDGDRDLDLAVGNSEGNVGVLTSNRLYLNLHRQLEARLQPLIGRTYEFELHAAPGYGTEPTLAIVAVSFGLLPTPVTNPPRVGLLYLASPLQLLPVVSIPSATGAHVIELAVPPSLSLVGASFYAQAALLNSPAQFTGYLAETFGQ